MPQSHPFQNNFTSGELSPRLNARSDLKLYKNGCFEMTNAHPIFEGGFTGRPGTQFLAPLRDQAEKGAFIPFTFSVSQAYMICVNDGYMRFFINKSLLTTTLVNISGASEVSGDINIHAISHGLSTGDYVSIAGVEGTWEANGVWKVTLVDADNFTLDSSTFIGTYTTGGTMGKVVELSCPYTESDLPNLRWAQDGDTLYIVDGTHIPYKLTRTSATSFTLSKWYPNGPYVEQGTQSKSVTMTWDTGAAGAIAAGASATITASAATFASTDVDRIIRIAGDVGTPALQGYARITAYTDTTHVVATVVNGLSSDAATGNWSFGAWGGTNGYPVDCTFHEQRLVMAGTTNDPQAFWGSFLNAPDDFVADAPSSNDDSYKYTVRAEEINVIRWLSSRENLLIGTAGQEFQIKGPNDTAIGPTSPPLITSPTRRGSSSIKPIAVDDTVLFMQWGGRRMYNLQYELSQDKLGNQDLTVPSRHLVPAGTTITALCYEEQPNNIVWAVRSDGVLLSLVYFPEQEILGWSKHTTQGLFEEAESIPDAAGGVNDTYLIVKRTVGFTTKRYVEVFNRDFNTDSTVSGVFGSPVSTLSGLNHLVGLDVVCKLDDGAGPTIEVSTQGQVVLTDNTTLDAEVGLAFTPTIIPLEPIAEGTAVNNSVSIGRKKKYGPIIIRTADTNSITVDGKTLPARYANQLMSATPPTPSLADWHITDIGYKTFNSITITQPLPLPITVVCIAGTMSVGER